MASPHLRQRLRDELASSIFRGRQCSGRLTVTSSCDTAPPLPPPPPPAAPPLFDCGLEWEDQKMAVKTTTTKKSERVQPGATPAGYGAGAVCVSYSNCLGDALLVLWAKDFVAFDVGRAAAVVALLLVPEALEVVPVVLQAVKLEPRQGSAERESVSTGRALARRKRTAGDVTKAAASVNFGAESASFGALHCALGR